jgi:xylulokinase
MHKQRKCMLGVDIGSSNMKVVFIDDSGRVLGSSSRELHTTYAHPRWAEQEPEDWFEALCFCVNDIFRKQGCSMDQLGAVCITAATHTPVLLDENDRLLRPAILWTDQRSASECSTLNEKHGDRIFDIAFHRASPTWTLPQLLWLQRHEPEVVKKVDRLFIAKDYLRYRLTGIWETDVIDAQGTLMLDYSTREWSKELCGYIEWPMRCLPPIRKTLDVAGPITAAAAKKSGLPEGVPVIMGGSDTALEDYGSGAISHQQGILKIATAGNANVMTHTPHRHPALFNYLHVIPGLWYIAAGTLSGAQVHKWLRDQVFSELASGYDDKKDAFTAIDELAADIPPGSDGMIFHPYLMGEKTPYMDPFLRGDYLGITIRHTRAHFVRALYEGISFSLLDCMNVYKPLGLSFDEIRLIGGGAKSALWRQILCDVIGQELLVPENNEAAFGAALVAGVGAGIFEGPKEAVDKCVRISIRHQPNMAHHERYMPLFEMYLEAQKLLAGINHKLHRFEMKE